MHQAERTLLELAISLSPLMIIKSDVMITSVPGKENFARACLQSITIDDHQK
jgi:hypothetical protein